MLGQIFARAGVHRAYVGFNGELNDAALPLRMEGPLVPLLLVLGRVRMLRAASSRQLLLIGLLLAINFN
jgi:hypothetical protein